MKMSRSQSMLVHSRPVGERKEQVINTSYETSTADIPQNGTPRLTTKLGEDEARTAFNEDQVRSSCGSQYSVSSLGCIGCISCNSNQELLLTAA